jgi:2-oxo-3-hexenedioate decarboxylase
MDALRIARELLDALDRGCTIPSIGARVAGFDWDAAYAVAAHLVKLRCARGERPAGRKIGFTNRNIWAEYGATAPIWAHVYDRTLVFATNGRAEISLAAAVQPRLEPEIAFGLRTPLAAGVSDPVRVLEAVQWYAPAFEIVDCHFADWKFTPPESAADFSFHWKLVVGPPCRVAGSDLSDLALRLRACRVTLEKGGRIADRGLGANALGHPAAALAHLADVLARQPQFGALSAGEVVTTGTLTAAMPIRPGENWSSRYEGLPGVTGLDLTFTA